MQLAFSYRSYRRRFRRPLKTAHGSWEAREGILVRLSDESGRFGLGEIAPLKSFGTESLEAGLQFCREREGRIEREEINGISRSLPCCRFACEEAYRLYSGKMALDGDRPGELPVAALLPAGTEALEVLPGVLARGYSVVKWKIGVYSQKVERNCFLRLLEGIPEGVYVRLDANGALTRKEAEGWITDASEAGVEFLEQPLPPSEEDALLRLAQDSSLSLALDESVAGARDLRQWMDRGWPGFFVIKPALMGSFEGFRNTVRQSGSANSFVFSSAFETCVGMKAALDWAFSFSEEASPRGVGFWTGGAFDDGFSPVLSPGIRWKDVEVWNLDAVWEEVTA